MSNFLIQSATVLRDDYHTLLRAFRTFDVEGKGYIEAEQMKLLMCSRGEPMTEEEANKLVVYAADENGRIYYVSGRECYMKVQACKYQRLTAGRLRATSL